MVPHDYRKVFDEAAALLFVHGRPLLFAEEGAVDLSNGQILFERDLGNAVVFHGDSIWYADGFSPMSACPERSVLVQRVGERWVPRHELNVHALHVRPWFEGSSLAAVVPRRAGPPWGYELTVLEKNRTPPVPERAGRAREAGCHTRIADLESFLAFRSGEIFALGRDCPLLPAETTSALEETIEAELEVPATLVMETWASGARQSTFSSLPFTELSSVEGVGARDIWAAGTLPDGTFALAHFDGQAWTVGPRRFDAPLSSLLVAPGDSGPSARRYFVSGKRLYDLRADELREHALPSDCEIFDIELDAEQLWVSCSHDFGISWFTTDPRALSFTFPSDPPERPRVTWRERKLPVLDPKGPRAGCGARRDRRPSEFGY